MRFICYVFWSIPALTPIQVRVYRRVCKTVLRWPSPTRSHFLMTAWTLMSDRERWFCRVKGHIIPENQELQDALQHSR